MSRQADQIRDKRRAFALPGGSLDKTVRLLAIALPAAIGAIVATMLISPLSPRGEVSFLLDRNKVDTAADRLRVDEARYRGRDNEGHPFSLTAGEAVQRSADEPLVRLQDLTARIALAEGPAALDAPAGRYDIEKQQVAVEGLLSFRAADGYRMTARDVSIDLPGRRLLGTGRVEGSIPAGTFSADTLVADLEARTIALVGNARLRMVPGQLRMP